jgi:hypothetical protein
MDWGGFQGSNRSYRVHVFFFRLCLIGCTKQEKPEGFLLASPLERFCDLLGGDVKI